MDQNWVCKAYAMYCAYYTIGIILIKCGVDYSWMEIHDVTLNAIFIFVIISTILKSKHVLLLNVWMRSDATNYNKCTEIYDNDVRFNFELQLSIISNNQFTGETISYRESYLFANKLYTEPASQPIHPPVRTQCSIQFCHHNSFKAVFTNPRSVPLIANVFDTNWNPASIAPQCVLHIEKASHKQRNGNTKKKRERQWVKTQQRNEKR